MTHRAPGDIFKSRRPKGNGRRVSLSVCFCARTSEHDVSGDVFNQSNRFEFISEFSSASVELEPLLHLSYANLPCLVLFFLIDPAIADECPVIDSFWFGTELNVMNNAWKLKTLSR